MFRKNGLKVVNTRVANTGNKGTSSKISSKLVLDSCLEVAVALIKAGIPPAGIPTIDEAERLSDKFRQEIDEHRGQFAWDIIRVVGRKPSKSSRRKSLAAWIKKIWQKR